MRLSDHILRLHYWRRRINLFVRGIRDRQVDTYHSLAELSRRYQAPEPPLNLVASEFKVFSQNGEDGVICALVNAVGAGDGAFVEFGIGAGIEGNCVFLADVLGWSGMFIEPATGPFEKLQFK